MAKGSVQKSKLSSKKRPAKKVVKTNTLPKNSNDDFVEPRQLKVAPYKSFRLQKKRHSPDKKILGSFRLFSRSTRILVRNWPLFLGIVIVYAVLSIILAGALSAISSNDVSSAKSILQGSFGSFITGLTLFALIAGNSGAGGGGQVLIMILVSLAIIWALRQVYLRDKTQKRPRIRDSFYEGVAPIIKYILVLVVIALELIPFVVGAFLYVMAVNNNIAITFPEKAIFGTLFFLLAIVSLYIVIGSIFATYIITLKDMTPVRALRSAVELVRYRRGRIFLRLLFIVILLTIISAVIVIPLSIWLSASAPYVFFALTLIFLAVFHSYVYALYRELM